MIPHSTASKINTRPFTSDNKIYFHGVIFMGIENRLSFFEDVIKKKQEMIDQQVKLGYSESVEFDILYLKKLMQYVGKIKRVYEFNKLFNEGRITENTHDGKHNDIPFNF